VARLDELRLMTRVARLYHEAGLRQPEIARRLTVSQSTISRLLQRAQREGIVRVTVSPPSGVFPEVEEALQERFGLREAIVVDSSRDDEEAIMRDLGAAAAYYVETTLSRGEVVGVESYASLRWMVDALRPPPGAEGVKVVQLSGGVGDPGSEQHHTQLTRRLATLLRGESVSLPAPGLAPSVTARRVFGADPFVRQAVALFDSVTLALLGIGAVAPPFNSSSFLGAFAPQEYQTLIALGAVGFIFHRFFGADGQPLSTPFDERVIAMTREQLRRVPRAVGISGSGRRLPAIEAALRGGWINVLITDRFTAARLLQSPAPPPPPPTPAANGVDLEAVPQSEVRL
jgi:DNA-binding transcriptional regulator LsrR (DeoR family)